MARVPKSLVKKSNFFFNIEHNTLEQATKYFQKMTHHKYKTISVFFPRFVFPSLSFFLGLLHSFSHDSTRLVKFPFFDFFFTIFSLVTESKSNTRNFFEKPSVKISEKSKFTFFLLVFPFILGENHKPNIFDSLTVPKSGPTIFSGWTFSLEISTAPP